MLTEPDKVVKFGTVPSMGLHAITLEVDEHVATITLDRPDASGPVTSCGRGLGPSPT